MAMDTIQEAARRLIQNFPSFEGGAEAEGTPPWIIVRNILRQRERTSNLHDDVHQNVA